MTSRFFRFSVCSHSAAMSRKSAEPGEFLRQSFGGLTVTITATPPPNGNGKEPTKKKKKKKDKKNGNGDKNGNKGNGASGSTAAKVATVVAVLFALIMPCNSQASHDCNINGTWYVTNACRPDEIYFFDGNMIVHSAGCVPCYQGNCTTPYYMSVSYINASGEFTFCQYVDYAALFAYTCDTFGLGELCSALIGTAEIIHRYKYYSKDFTCECECAYQNAHGNAQAAFFQALGDKLSIIGDIFEYIAKIPTGIFTILQGNYPVVVCIAVLKSLTGNWIMALMYLLLAGYCAGGMYEGGPLVEVPTYDRSLTFHIPYNTTNCTNKAIVRGLWTSDDEGKKPFPCFWGGFHQNVQFVPKGKVNTSIGIPDCTGGVYFSHSPFLELLKANYSYYCGSYNLFTSGSGIRNLTFYGTSSQICVFVTKDKRKNTTMGIYAACYVDKRRDFCGDCFWDCQKEDPRKTYEACGVGWMINEDMAWNWGNKSKKLPTSRAVIGNYDHEILCLNARNKTKFKYPLKMPGRPLIRDGRATPCYGYAWPTGAIGSGLVVLDCDHAKDKCVQYFFAQHFLYHIHWLTHFLILIILAAMTGGRVVPIIWAMITMHIVEIEGAVNFAIPSALVVNGILSYQSLASVFYAIIVAYLCHDVRLAPYVIAVCKVALGYPVLAVSSIILTYYLRDHAVGGMEFKVCFDVHVPDSWIFNIDVDLAFLVMMILSIVWFYGMTRPGRLLKIRILYAMTYWHEKTYLFLNNSIVGAGRGFDYCIFVITFLLVLFFPKSTTIIIILFYTSTMLIDLAWLSSVYFAEQKFKLQGMIKFCEIIADGGDYFGTSLCFKLADKLRLPPVFRHLGHISRRTAEKLKKLQMTLEPVGYQQEVEYVQDDARMLACGDFVYGKPVFGRIGNWALLGRTKTIPSKVKLTAPLSVVRVRSTGFPKAVCYGVVGKDYADHQGSIFGLSTGLTSFMGFVLGSNLVTVQHGARSRPLSTRVGSTPGWYSSNDDIACYPAPGGTTPLCKCNCIVHKAYMFIKSGECMELTKNGDHWIPALVRPVKWYKGSSGTPILCPEGHVIQMFVGVGSKKLGAVRVIGKDIELKNVNYVKPEAPDKLPEVPSHQEVLTFIAPTGFGKSTKVPLDYASKGNNVLVCCPSVAAVTRIVSFMKEVHRVDCNLHAGDIDVECGGRITYCTYGKMLTNLQKLDNFDVILLDECHSTDSTTVLGIGAILVRAPNLKAKLILLMTATPPGTPMTPHQNINEEILGTAGDVDFYGKKINSIWYKEGRHLILCATKKECHRVAHELAGRGVKTHVYYRGLDAAEIPSGQCTVVATDAISTGYNGDFDTVTDCCVMVEETATIDLAPTITISRRVVPATNALRMQRRGRCGRGRAGLYRYVDSLSSFGGCIEYAAILEAFDTGISWYNLETVFITAALTAYNDQYGLPNLVGNYADISAFYNVLKTYNALPEVSVAKHEGFSYALLTGVQAWLCKEFKSSAPNDSVRWNVYKLRGEAPVPLIANIDDVCTKTTQSSDVAKKLLDALGVEIACSGLTFLGVGLAVICAIQVVESASCVVIRDDFELQTVSGKDIINPDLWTNLLEECSAMPAIANYCSVAVNHATAFCAKLCLFFKTPTTTEKALKYLSTYSPHIGGLCSLFLSVMLGRRNPVLTSLLAGAGTFLTPAPFWIKLLLGVIGSGMLAMRDAPVASSALLAGGVAGALLSRTGFGGLLFGAAVTANASVAACDITFSILTGNMPPTYRWWDMIAAIGSPGGALVGIVLGIILKVATKKGLSQWTNRLLALGSKGNACPDFFVQVGKEEEKILELLHTLSFTRAIIKFSTDFNSDFTQCSSPITDIAVAIWNKILMYARTVVEKGREFMPSLKFGCDRAISVKVEGTGMIASTCSCGNRLHYVVSNGVVSKTYSSYFCRNSWSANILLNNSTTIQNVIVHQPQGSRVYRYGLSDFVEVSNINGVLQLIRSSTLNINRVQLRFALTTKPVAIDGCNWFYRKVDAFLPGSEVYLDGVKVDLPFVIRSGEYTVVPREGTQHITVIAVNGCDGGELLEYFEDSDQYSYNAYVNFPEFQDTQEVIGLLKHLQMKTNGTHVLIAGTKQDEFTIGMIIGEITMIGNPKTVSLINYGDEEMGSIMGVAAYNPPRTAGGLIRIFSNSSTIEVTTKCRNHNIPDCDVCTFATRTPTPLLRCPVPMKCVRHNAPDCEVCTFDSRDYCPQHDRADCEECMYMGRRVTPETCSVHGQPDCDECFLELRSRLDRLREVERPPQKKKCSAHNDPDCDVCSAAISSMEWDPTADGVQEQLPTSSSESEYETTSEEEVLSDAQSTAESVCEEVLVLASDDPYADMPPLESSDEDQTNRRALVNTPDNSSLNAEKIELECKDEPKAKVGPITHTPLSELKPEDIPKKKSVRRRPQRTKPVKEEEIEMYHKCSKPFTWTGAAISTKKRVTKFAVSLFGVMGRNRNNLYWSDPTTIRTMIERHHRPPPSEYLEVVKSVIKRVSGMKCRKLTLQEASVLTKKSAASSVSGITYKDVKALNKKAVTAIKKAEEHFLKGTGDSRLSACTIMPKTEIFGRDPDKMSEKPARHVVYAPLETRVLEKIYLGDVTGRVIKHVLGKSYGAQYTPHERAKLLHGWWTGMTNPVGFTCDAISFDQQITSEDMDIEMAIQCATRMSNEQRTMIHSLYNKLYKSSLLYNDRGIIVGKRFCRGSGTYVTSMNNVIAWMKLYTACKKAELKNFKLLVNGDDCVCIFESDFKDKEQVAKVEETLKACNFETKPIEPKYSLDELEVCSSNVTLAVTYDNRMIPLLTRNPLHPLAKAMAESNRDNPISKWIGNIIMYAGTYWCRWLSVGLLDYWSRSNDGTCEAELFGNTYQLRFDQICPIIKHLNPEAFNIKNYTMPEIQRSWKYLSHLGYQTHRELVRRAVRLRVRILRRNPEMHCLLPLLNFCVKTRIEVKNSLDIIDFSRPYESVHYDHTVTKSSLTTDILAGVCSVLACLALLILV